MLVGMNCGGNESVRVRHQGSEDQVDQRKARIRPTMVTAVMRGNLRTRERRVIIDASLLARGQEAEHHRDSASWRTDSAAA